MNVHALLVPYDSAQRNARMGAGPERLFGAAIQPVLRERSTPLDLTVIEASQPFAAEIATAFHLHRLVASGVRTAICDDRFPLVLSGNCNAAIGTTAALRSNDLGIIWLDAHGDFNTPETTASGFLDGMGLATIAGLCWKNMASSIPGFRPLRGDNILHLGSRELSDGELRNMSECGAEQLSADDLNRDAARASLRAALQRLRARASNVYVHLDMDVLDPAEACANEFSPPGGLSVRTAADVLQAIADLFNISALGIASYDPAHDPEGRVTEAAKCLLRTVFPSSSTP